MATLEGKWTLVKSENFDEYLKALGVGFLMRKAAASATPTQEIKFQGDGAGCFISTVTSIKSMEISCLFGVEFDEQTADGRNVKSTMTLEDSGRRLIHTQQKGTPTEVTFVRQLGPDGQGFVMTIHFKDVIAKRYFQRITE